MQVNLTSGLRLDLHCGAAKQYNPSRPFTAHLSCRFAMSANVVRTMRLVSPRLRSISQNASPQIQQARLISQRYSSPSKRSVTTAPDVASSFTGLGQGAVRFEPAPLTRNPLDARAARLAHEEQRAYHLRRMRFAGMGLLLSLAATALIISNLDLDKMEESENKRRSGQQLDASDEANAKFQGKEVQVIGAGQGKRIVAHGNGEEIELVETGTSTIPHFPRTIYLPSSPDSSAPTAMADVVSTAQPNTPQNPNNISNQEEYTLVGLGIRTVMWIQVYVVGMYVRTTDISELQAKLIRTVNPTASTLIPSEKDELRKRLLDPETSREIWSEILKVPGIKTALLCQEVQHRMDEIQMLPRHPITVCC